MNNEEETVTITRKEYQTLLNDADFLACLQAAGVDNWEWYDDAVLMYEEGGM